VEAQLGWVAPSVEEADTATDTEADAQDEEPLDADDLAGVEA
jgi:hypothetical protein